MIPVRALQAMLRIWHRWISAMFPPMCRFYPSCSVYAVEALDKHRFPKAASLIVWRLLRCQPLHPGGFDPVPEPATRPGYCSPEAIGEKTISNKAY